MWTDAELANWEQTRERSVHECRQTKLDASLHAVLSALDRVDDEAEVARIAKELELSFRCYADPVNVNAAARTEDGVRPLCGVLFYYAGTEVEPYVPSQVWGQGVAEAEVTVGDGAIRHIKKRAVNFGDCPGYELGAPAKLLLHAAETDDAIDERDGYCNVYKAVVLDSLRLASRALQRLVVTSAFDTLPKTSPFSFWATPGHDEPRIELLKH